MQVILTASAFVFIGFCTLVLIEIHNRPGKEEEIDRELRLFSMALIAFVMDGGEIPNSNLTNVIDAMDDHLKNSIPNRPPYECDEWPSVKKGVDRWGNALIFSYSKKSKTVIVRSLGRNGRDENGNGDDIQRIIHLPAG
ncbi:MAG: hypothetical protein V4719_29185 [Planctomycetota bacterium]